MIKKFIYTVFSVCLIFVLTGCGGKGNDAPEGTEITVTPGSITISDAGAVRWDQSSFTIIVKNEDDIPLSNVRLNISFPFARSARLTSGFVVQLLNDDGNSTNSPMEAVTGTNGTYVLRFDYLRGSLSYNADILITSGTSSVIPNFTVEDGS